MKRTRIVATIGPASASRAVLTASVRSGLNVARLNFSHGSYTEHARFISLIRSVAKKEKKIITILQDLSGPKIRVGELPENGVKLAAGAKILFSNNPKRRGAIPFQYKGLPQDVKNGDRILLDDGLLEVEVVSVASSEVAARVVTGGILFSHKGMNVPTARLRVPAITEKDKRDLKFGLAHAVDWVALSFVRDPRDIEHLRRLIAAAHPAHAPRIIAKIEKHEAVEHIEEIIHAADGVMVARGDLGIEIPAEQVPLIQKHIIRLATRAQKPVVVATQMLDSMIRNPRPTRAEVSDVANAVIDGTDGVMLSGETASGAYPKEAVAMMSQIVVAIETAPPEHQDLLCQYLNSPHGFEDQLVGEIAVASSSLHEAAAVIVPRASMHLVPLISRFRPRTIILAQVGSAAEAGVLNAHYGVYPIQANGLTRRAGVAATIKTARKNGIIKRGDRAVVMSESKKGGLLSVEEMIVR